MLVATMRIRTADGMIQPGQQVKGLSKEDMKEFRALGYIVDDKELNADSKPQKSRIAVTRSKPKVQAAAQVEQEASDDADDQIDSDDSGNDTGGQTLPGVSEQLQ